MNGIIRKKCRHCRKLFVPDHRNRSRQKYCGLPECQMASKAASQKKWLNKPENQDYFQGPEHVERVRQWRKKNPKYWKSKSKTTLVALQDPLIAQQTENNKDICQITDNTLQDSLITQPSVLIGLISNFIGSALQDDIANTLLRLQQSGRDILNRQQTFKGGQDDCEITDFNQPGPQGAQKLQLDRPPPGTQPVY